MHLAHVSHQYPPAIGGSERYIADLSEELAARGNSVDVLTSKSRDYHNWRNDLPPYERLNGVNVHRYCSLRRRAYVWRLLHFGLRHYWSNHDWWWEPFIFFGGGPLCPGMFLDILCRAPRYDLVHLNCLVYSHVAYAYWAAKQRAVPTIVTPHLHIDQPNTYIIGFMLRTLRGCDHIIAVTEAERRHIVGLGVNEQRVTTVGNGVHPEAFPSMDKARSRRQFDLPEDAFVLLFFGRKDDYKGIGRILEAYSVLQAHHPRLYLLTVGPETDFSRALAMRFAALPRWINHGAVSDELRLHAFNAANCLALPSEGEAFGIVFLEAWLMKLAVIGPRNPAVATVISESQDGLLVAPTSVDELIRAVRSIIEAPEWASTMGENGRKKVLQRYTVSRITDQVECIYQQVINARNPNHVRC
jgi:glycosyltransferase involved in cell wall biosynthesis